MTAKPTLATIVTVTALLAALASLWVTLKTTANQRTFHLRLLSAESELQDVQIALTNFIPPDMAIQMEAMTSNVTAQIDALRVELRVAPAPAPTHEAGVGGISTPGPNMRYYLIRAGDTFTSIADNHGVALEDLEDANPRIDHDDLDIGQRIKIPIYPVAE